jgi:NAD-dependent SIR2 family protein deacetylase
MRVFLVTGAGVSAESGLGTFRDKSGTGIWTRFDPMKLATPEAFARDPQEVYAFYNARRRNLIAAKPDAAHFALARLETALAERGGNLTLVTQNIDDLHERAGSKRVIHMHGELLKARCTACDTVSPWIRPRPRRVGLTDEHFLPLSLGGQHDKLKEISRTVAPDGHALSSSSRWASKPGASSSTSSSAGERVLSV